MAQTTMTVKTPSRRLQRLGLHLLTLVLLFAVAVLVATVHGGLWPFDLRFSALITAGGIAVLTMAWWPAAMAIGLVAALMPRPLWRLLLWPLAVLAMLVLHAALGSRLDFMPLSGLGPHGALQLYTIPVAISVLLGSLLRDILPRRCVENTTPAADTRSFQERKLQ